MAAYELVLGQYMFENLGACFLFQIVMEPCYLLSQLSSIYKT